jgi:hypothetical protein
MRRHFAILVLFVCIGCESRPNQVEYVVPNGFRGMVKLIYRADAPKLPIIDGRYVFRIADDGILFYGGYDPLRSYLCTARFANGDPIWVSQSFNDHPDPGQVGLFGGSSYCEWGGKIDENDGKLVQRGLPEIHYFFGTEQQWKPQAR